MIIFHTPMLGFLAGKIANLAADRPPRIKSRLGELRIEKSRVGHLSSRRGIAARKLRLKRPSEVRSDTDRFRIRRPEIFVLESGWINLLLRRLTNLSAFAALAAFIAIGVFGSQKMHGLVHLHQTHVICNKLRKSVSNDNLLVNGENPPEANFVNDSNVHDKNLSKAHRDLFVLYSNLQKESCGVHEKIRKSVNVFQVNEDKLDEILHKANYRVRDKIQKSVTDLLVDKNSQEATNKHDFVHPPLASIQTQVRYGVHDKMKETGNDHNSYVNDEPMHFMLNSTLQRAETYTFASQVPNPRTWSCWVSDQARVLSRSAVEHLNSVIDALEYDTGMEITVVTVQTLGKKVSAKEFAAELYKAWRIEQASQGRGMLFLVVASEGRFEVELGWNIVKVLKGDGLWDSGYEAGWLDSLVRRGRRELLRGDPERVVVQAVERVAERVWEAAGYPKQNTQRKWVKFVDLAWLSLLLALSFVSLLVTWISSIRNKSLRENHDIKGLTTGKVTRRHIRSETT